MKTYDDYLHEWEKLKRCTKERIDKDAYIAVQFLADHSSAAFVGMNETDAKLIRGCIRRTLERMEGNSNGIQSQKLSEFDTF